MANSGPDSQSNLIPSIGLVVGGVLWGLFWIPIRWIGDAGLDGAWPSFFIYGFILLLFLPMVFLRPGLIINSWRSLFLCGFFAGSAFTLYAISLYFTDVIRVLLLFYMTPVWSTILGVLILGEKVGKGRIVALICGILGLLVILGLGRGFPWPSNLGDWLALLAGLSWTIGSVLIYRLHSSSVFELMLAFAMGSLVSSGFLLALGTPQLAPPLDYSDFTATIALLLLSCMLVLPMLYLTMWPTSVLSPGRVGILLMSEIIVGILSAAWLANEPFGVREVIGSILIVGAGFAEVLWPEANTKS